MPLPVPAAVPVQGGRLLSRQGPRPVRRYWHNGTDWAEESGQEGFTPARSIANGVVETTDRSGVRHQYGNVVSIRHDNDMLSVYAHLDRILVQPGQQVWAGQPIGIVGSTFGTAEDPTARLAVPHLHLEIVKSWPLSSRDHESRYDVLHELEASGVNLQGRVLVAGEPRVYYEPALEEAKSGAGSDYPVLVAGPELGRPGPGHSSWLGPVIVLSCAAVVGTLFWATIGLRKEDRNVERHHG